MPGVALSAFEDFFNTTGPSHPFSSDMVVNDASLRNYEAYDFLSRSKKEVKGGTSINDVVIFSDGDAAQTYLPGETGTIVNQQFTSTITVPWRQVRSYVEWNEHEIMKNGGDSSITRDSRFHQFKKLRDIKYQAAYSNLYTKMERLFVAAASNDQMEADGGQEPHSIFSTITSDGLAPPGYTTVQGINPTTESNWRNQAATYTFATPMDQDTGIIAGFDAMSQLVRFKRPEQASGDPKDFTDSDFKQVVVLTNREGRRDYMKAVRANNDITRAGAQDPAYGDASFLGIRVKACEGFDDQSTFTAGQPGFVFLHGDFIKLICHTDKWMDKSKPMDWAEKPDTRVVWFDNWLQIFNRSRRRHGFLSAA